MKWTFEISNSASRDTVPLTRPHLLVFLENIFTNWVPSTQLYEPSAAILNQTTTLNKAKFLKFWILFQPSQKSHHLLVTQSSCPNILLLITRGGITVRWRLLRERIIERFSKGPQYLMHLKAELIEESLHTVLV